MSLSTDNSIYLLISALILFILLLSIGLFFLYKQLRSLEKKQADSIQQETQHQLETQRLESELKHAVEAFTVQKENTQKQEELTASLEKNNHALALEKQALLERSTSLASQLEKAETTLNAQLEKIQALQSSIERFQQEALLKEAELKHKAERLEAQNKDFEAQKNALKDEFKALSAEILEAREAQFEKTNSDGLSKALSPLKEEFNKFKQRVDQVHTEQTKGQGLMEKELTQLRQMNTQLSDRAENLTNALRQDKKKLGNWGELQLERILENSGLTKDCYRREANYKTDDGHNQRPDFVIDLPQSKHIIIDSKVSLNAYVDAVNASNEDEAIDLMNQHVNAIRTHINTLSSKSYDSLSGLNTPDFVFMFLPNEAAFLAAFEQDPRLFDYAFDKHVAVVTPTTLMPILRTVSTLWRIDKQNQSTEELALSAEKVHTKLAVFLEKFQKLGAQLVTASNSFEDAQKTLSGKGSLFKLIDDFREKGVKVTKKLPQPPQ